MATPQLPPPSNPAMLPVLATVTYVAAVVALWGILSVALDRDVIPFALQGRAGNLAVHIRIGGTTCSTEISLRLRGAPAS